MRIGIDARAAVARLDGVGRYAIELLRGFSLSGEDHEFVVLKHPSLDMSLQFDRRFHEITCLYPRYGIREQFTLPKLLQGQRLDLFHSLHFTVPLAYSGATVITVHDIMPMVFPSFFGTEGVRNWIAAKYMSALVGLSLKRAVAVIADSDHTAKDVSTYFTVDSSRIRRVYPGIDHLGYDRAAVSPAADNVTNVKSPFLLTVTNFRPYKNIALLLRVWDVVRSELPDFTFVVVGGNEKYRARMLGDAALERQQVRFLGSVSDPILAHLLKTATAFVFPSLYEGFGFPILEAMEVGTPVLTSNAASLPEVGGDAVLYADPRNTDELQAAILRISRDSELRKSLSERGRTQAAKFRWHDAAHQTLQVYEEALREWGGQPS